MVHRLAHGLGPAVRCICTGSGAHPNREVAYISGRVDEDGYLWLFDAEVSTGGQDTLKFDLGTTEGRRQSEAFQQFFQTNPPPSYLESPTPDRSSPQRDIRADEKVPWRFFCHTCRSLDLKVSTQWVAELWRKAMRDDTMQVDLSRPDTPKK